MKKQTKELIENIREFIADVLPLPELITALIIFNVSLFFQFLRLRSIAFVAFIVTSILGCFIVVSSVIFFTVGKINEDVTQMNRWAVIASTVSLSVIIDVVLAVVLGII